MAICSIANFTHWTNIFVSSHHVLILLGRTIGTVTVMHPTVNLTVHADHPLHQTRHVKRFFTNNVMLNNIEKLWLSMCMQTVRCGEQRYVLNYNIKSFFHHLCDCSQNETIHKTNIDTHYILVKWCFYCIGIFSTWSKPSTKYIKKQTLNTLRKILKWKSIATTKWYGMEHGLLEKEKWWRRK